MDRTSCLHFSDRWTTARRLGLATCVIAVSVSMADSAAAQSDERPLVGLEGRVGPFWSGEPLVDGGGGTVATIGGQFSFYPFAGELGERLSVQVGGDYAERDEQTFRDPVLGDARTYRYVFLVSPGIGFDLIQTPRALITLRVGGSIIGEGTTFSLRLADGGEYEDVCRLAAFEPRCPNDYEGAAHAGIGFRVFRSRSGQLTFGTTYTWVGGGRHHLAGTIGWMEWTKR